MNSALVVLYEELNRLQRYIVACKKEGIGYKNVEYEYYMLQDILNYAQNKYMTDVSDTQDINFLSPYECKGYLKDVCSKKNDTGYGMGCYECMRIGIDLITKENIKKDETT